VTVTTLSDHWDALTSAALLGTTRRAAPPPPAGPLADLAARRVAPSAAESVLDAAAALVAVRRGGVRPGPLVDRLVPCPPDARPICPSPAALRLHDIIATWPVLVDEWLTCLLDAGWRLPPELAVLLLSGARRDPNRRARVVAAAGPLATWLAELFADLAPLGGRGSSASGPDGGVDVSGLDLPPDLDAMRRLDATTLATALGDGLGSAAFANRHRPLLVKLICTVPPAHLPVLASALGRAVGHASTMGLAVSLADLASTRHAMIEELQP
jgi:hypothetical protein